MSRFRRFYYDVFSLFYDAVIRLHSKDEGAGLRDFLVGSSGLKGGDTHLDICTGTGSVALRASRAVQPGGKVVAVDFSRGMLKKALTRIRGMGVDNVHLVEADVASLPFREGVFDVATCSHAMYELSGEARRKGLWEVQRTLKGNGTFCMMEHEVPEKPFTRFLYGIRLTAMGSAGNRAFARDETPELAEHFTGIRKTVSPTGRSKLLSGVKSPDPAP